MSASPSPEPVQPKSRRGLVISLLVVLSMVIGGFVGAQIAQSGDDTEANTDSTEVATTIATEESNSDGSEVTTAPSDAAPGSSDEPVATAPETNGDEPEMNVADVLSKIQPSVVTITAITE